MSPVAESRRPPADADGASGRGRGALAFRAQLLAARALGALSRRSGRGGGTTLPGRFLLRVAPDAIARLAAGLSGPRTVISATNGKTTMAGMLASILAEAGREPVHNRAGSNMAWGVATALLSGRGEEGLFEVDEAWLPRVAAELGATHLVLGNLFRDQLDRYGELERIADDWAAMIDARPGTELVLNADDPLIADLGRDRAGARRPAVTMFGIDDPAQAAGELQHASDAKHCRRCGTPYAYERAFVGHLGHYSCPGCGAARPRPDVSATAIDLHGIDGSAFTVAAAWGTRRIELPLPGLYNVYNGLAAIAAADRLGVGPEAIVAGLSATRAAFGRVETIAVGGTALSILLIKNPAGANEVLRTLRLEAERRGEPLDLWIALNDRIADGRDVSWIWDADFELLGGAVRRVVCAGTRAAELALRLRYGGWPRELIEVEPAIGPALDRALDGTPERLFALPTYTALIELRTLLARRGLAREFWR